MSGPGVGTRALRSAAWFGQEGKLGMVYRSHSKSQGYADDVFDGRPVIGIANSWSELAPCNVHLRAVAEAVKRGVWERGGLPLEFPTMSLGETLVRPTSMLYRNLMAMETEESIRSNPLDAVVLLAGCDKTTPAQVMGATSVDLPAILVTGGPMINGRFRGEAVGSGTDVWRLSENARAGAVSAADLRLAEGCVSRSNGHCTTMGTASTMACLTEALGLQLPGSAAIPAVDAGRYKVAQAAGRRIVEMVDEDLRPSRLLTREAFENAIRVNAAIGGSTNAVVHLLAMAGRAGVALDLDDFDRLGEAVPVLVDLKPTGRFLMEELAAAGGLPAVLLEIADLLHLDALTVTGRTLGEELEGVACFDREVVRPRHAPLLPAGNHTIVLRGNLCPDGAVLKLSAASPDLLRHRGRALVYDSIEEYDAAMDTELPGVDATTVLVLRNAGPRGYPGMPEVGNLPLPRRLLQAGVRDMVRLSDARMSGTAYGTVVLHVAPESAVGGPLALVRSGDWVVLDAPARRLDMEVPEPELARRAGEG
ncbi:MAG: IlvD/Edd family dehydratase, partial [Acidimicrobiales bacterium]